MAGPLISPDSELGKELLKWEQHRTRYVPDEAEPGNKYVFRPYPKMLYRARTTESGKAVCLETPPPPYLFPDAASFDRACQATEIQNKQCYRIVQSAREHEAALSEGWRDTQAEALAHYEALQQDIAQAAAEAQYAVQRMSEKARAEFAAAGERTHAHVVDVAPARKPGRKPTAIAPADLEARDE